MESLLSNAVKLKLCKSIPQSVAILQRARLGQASLWDWNDDDSLNIAWPLLTAYKR